MAASKSVCRVIVQKDRMFFQADRRDVFQKGKPIFSMSPFDAKVFRDEKAAHEKAKKIGGRVRLFDAINGEFI